LPDQLLLHSSFMKEVGYAKNCNHGAVTPVSCNDPPPSSLYTLGQKSSIPKHTEIFSHLVTALSIHG
jgi:hypothetical protein